MAPLVKKRKLPSSQNPLLQRRVRPRVEPESDPDENEQASSDDASSGEEEGQDTGKDQSSGPEDDERSETSSESESEDDEDDNEDEESSNDAKAELLASQISFGALARAQSATGASSRSAPDDDNDDDESNSDDEQRGGGGKPKRGEPSAAKHAPDRKPAKRSSQQAPAEVSSKKPVSRRREVAPGAPTRPQPRDPRFFAPAAAAAAANSTTTGAASASLEETRARRAYAFLDGYRNDEMQQLRRSIADIDRFMKNMRNKKSDGGGGELTKTQRRNFKGRLPEELRGLKRKELRVERARLAKTLEAMEARRREQEKRDRKGQLLAVHRRQEKEQVARGKRPFYLKKSEQREKLLADDFARMGKGKVERAMARKQKKVAARERRDLPVGRVAKEDR